jgi:putative membrane protein
MVVCGGCEKIKNTLLSVSYRMFVKHVMILFILMMPLSILDNVGLYSIPIVIVTSYIILALEAIARNLEEPFGITEDHIQLCAINSNIKLSVHEILGVQYQNSN